MSSPTARSPSAADRRVESRGVWAAATVGVLLAAVGVAFREIGDWDAWWQLLIGRVALDAHTTLPVDTFSYSVAGAPWPHKDLAGYIVLELGHRLGGFVGLSLVRATVAFGVMFALLQNVQRQQRKAWAWLAVGALLVGANEFRFIPRALMFSELGFIGLLALIERVREHVAARPNVVPWARFGAIVVWMIVWTNLHRGALLGHVVTGGFVAALVLARLLDRLSAVSRRGGAAAMGLGVVAGWPTIGAALLTWVLAVAGGCLNASGIAVYTTGLAVSYDPIHRGFISEWHPVTLALATHEFAPITAIVALSWVLGGLALARRFFAPARSPDCADETRSDAALRGGVDLWHVGVLAVMTWQGLSSLRWLSFATAAAAVVVIRYLCAPRRCGTAATIRPAVALALAAAIALPLPLLRNGRAWGVAEVPDRYPVGALEFAREHSLATNVHNAFVFGGYVAWAGWPDFRVLIDGRNDMVYRSEFYLRCIEAQTDPAKFDALQAEFETDWVLAENTAGRETFVFLENDPAWMAVYWSEAAIIWVRRDRHPQLAALEFSVLDVRDPVASMLAAAGASQPGDALDTQLRSELQRFAEASPSGVRALTLLIIYFDLRGERERRDAALAVLEQNAADSPVLEQLRARLSP